MKKQHSMILVFAIFGLMAMSFAAAEQQSTNLARQGAAAVASNAGVNAVQAAGSDDDAPVPTLIAAPNLVTANKLNKRQISAEKLNEAKAKFEGAKSRYQVAKANHQENKGEFDQLRLKIKECAEENTEECEQAKSDILEKSKEIIKYSADVGIEHLNKVKARINEAKGLTEEEAAEMIADIDERIANLEAKKEAADAAETKEEIKGLRDQVKSAIAKLKIKAQVQQQNLVRAKTGEIVARAKSLETRMKRVAERLKAAGTGIEGLDENTAEFTAKIENAKVAYESAKEMINEARAMSLDESEQADVVAKIKESNEKLKEANGLLKEANEILVSVMKKLVANNETIPEGGDEE